METLKLGTVLAGKRRKVDFTFANPVLKNDDGTYATIVPFGESVATVDPKGTDKKFAVFFHGEGEPGNKEAKVVVRRKGHDHIVETSYEVFWSVPGPDDTATVAVAAKEDEDIPKVVRTAPKGAIAV
jgi:hypothetical protein